MARQSISRIGIVLALALCAGCAAHADQATKPPITSQGSPPQVTAWQPLANFSKQYIGATLSIEKDDIKFSIAGTFRVAYVGAYGSGTLYKVIGENVPNRQSKSFICRSKLSYLAITPGEIKIIHEPILSFKAFEGKTMPIWHDRNTDNGTLDCGEFSYGAPLNQ